MAVAAVEAAVVAEAVEAKAEAEVAAVVTKTNARVCFMRIMERAFSVGSMSLNAKGCSRPLKSGSWTPRLGITSETR